MLNIVTLKMGDGMAHALSFLTASLCPADATLLPCLRQSPLTSSAGKAENQLQKSINWSGDAPHDAKVPLIAS